MLQLVQTCFVDKFSNKPYLFRSPGRINIIGEHTDYNEGFVLPAAINKELYFAVAPNNKGFFRFYATNLNEYTEISELKIQKEKTWSNYLLGVVDQLQKVGISVPNIDVVVGGNIPIGMGVSSSAAMECGFLFALNSIFEYGFSTLEMVKMAQKAEHEFAGVKCGIMDQFAVMFGKKDHVIKIDCRSHDYQYFPLQIGDYNIFLCDSAVKHTLASSEYNIRRQECEQGVKILSQKFPNIHSLRDVSMEQIEDCASQMTPKVLNRCVYVVGENIRLEKACQAMNVGDIQSVGEMMYTTHEGLSRLYEVSCKELDALVQIAHSQAGVVGARVMGGGFGGCTINLVHQDVMNDFKEKVRKEYYQKFGKKENFMEVKICDGTSQL